jgi:zinc/manganese transport system ATP-binding protein
VTPVLEMEAVRPVLEMEGVSIVLGGRRVLDQVDLRVDQGQFIGLIGSNGAGKTTLLRTILGLLTPSAGRVLVAGRPLGARNRLIGYVPQKISLDPDMPIRARDVVGLGLDGHRFGLPPLGRSRRGSERRRRVDEALASVGASSFADARIGRLSGGQQQRVMVAQALVGRPRLLLLDEPLANLDISSTTDIVAVLARVCREQAVSVLISAHDMNPLLPFMDRIAYMADGRLASGPTDDVVQTEVLTGLYRYPVEVLRVHGRVLVAGAGAEAHCP